MFAAVDRFLRALAGERPVALFIDDLHWADDATVELTHHLAWRTRGARVLLIMTVRRTDVRRDSLLADTMRDLGREHLVDLIKIPLLDMIETEALLAQTLPEPGPNDLALRLYRATEGNPFFIKELLRSLIERGLVGQVEGLDAAGHFDELAIPETVRDVINERVARLSSDARDALILASVLGQTFEFDAVQAIKRCSEAELEAALGETIAAGLVHELGAMTYRFDHALTQASIDAYLSVRRRAKIHIAAAEALQQAAADQPASASQLARHFLAGAIVSEVFTTPSWQVTTPDQCARQKTRRSSTNGPPSSRGSWTTQTTRRKRCKSLERL
jgi:predicted ATPase